MKVSVLVHNLNRATALSRCLVSIAEQTYRPIEVIIADAGSTDESLSVMLSARRRAATCASVRATCTACTAPSISPRKPVTLSPARPPPRSGPGNCAHTARAQYDRPEQRDKYHEGEGETDARHYGQGDERRHDLAAWSGSQVGKSDTSSTSWPKRLIRLTGDTGRASSPRRRRMPAKRLRRSSPPTLRRKVTPNQTSPNDSAARPISAPTYRAIRPPHAHPGRPGRGLPGEGVKDLARDEPGHDARQKSPDHRRRMKRKGHGR